MIAIVFFIFLFLYSIYKHNMEPVCAKCQNKFIPQFKYNKTLQHYKMCETCRPIKTNINVDCINFDKFDKLTTDLRQSVETNKQVLK